MESVIKGKSSLNRATTCGDGGDGLHGKSPRNRATTCGDGGDGSHSIGKLFSVSHMPCSF